MGHEWIQSDCDIFITSQNVITIHQERDYISAIQIHFWPITIFPT